MASRRALALVSTVLLTLAIAQPLSATTTTGATATTVAGGTATTGVVETTTGEAIVPAVSTEVTEPLETQPDWTYRFFIPTLLVIAALVVIMTVIRYFTGVVRKRYRVVR